MAEIGAEYAAEAVRAFWAERLDAEVDRIEAASPSLSIGTLPAVASFQRWRQPQAKSPVLMCYSAGRLRRAPLTRGCADKMVAEIACELRLIPRHLATSQQPQHLEAGLERWLSAIWAAAYGGCGGATRVTSLTAAAQLNDRVADSMVREIRHTPLFTGEGARVQPAPHVNITWVHVVTLYPANT